jgi:hypothetical protein
VPRSEAFLAPAHGLLRMPTPPDDQLIRVIGFEGRKETVPGIQPPSHACVAALIMNGYVNDATPPIDTSLLTCLEGCDEYDSAMVRMPLVASLLLTRSRSQTKTNRTPR